MEYAAVFILFAAITASAIRLAATGKGFMSASFLVVLTVLLCLEPTKGAVRYAPSALFLALSGAAYIGRRKNPRQLLCALVVAAVAYVSTDSAWQSDNVKSFAVICQIALAACVCEPRGAGAVFALGRFLGDTYSVLTDPSVVLREQLFSIDIVFSAIVCTVASFFFNAVFSFIDGDRRRLMQGKPLFVEA